MDRGHGRVEADAAGELGLERIDEDARTALHLEVLPLVEVRVQHAANGCRRSGPGKHRAALQRAVRRRQRAGLADSVREPRWLERSQQRADREIVEARRVWMGPRVGRVDVGRDPQELLVEAVEGREVLAGKPVVADVRAL